MAKARHESDFSGDYVDRQTWRRVKGAMVQLATKDPKPYLLSGSFLSQEQSFIDKHYPDQVLGICTERGDLTSGKLRFTWFADSADKVLAEIGQESLRGQLEFAKQSNGTYFYGTMRMYDYANGEGEITLDAAGYSANDDWELGFEYNAFAQEIGVARLWSSVDESSGNSVEQQFKGKIDRQASLSVAYALSKLNKTGL